jgi:hypothetical protein
MPIPSLEQTAVSLSTSSANYDDLCVTPREKRLLQNLARTVSELAARPIEAEKQRLWTLHNDLHATRPLVFCDPEHGWNEIIPQASLECEDPLLRVWEMTLRKEIFWGATMQDDRVIEPYFNVPYSYVDCGYGVSETVHKVEAEGSYVYDSPIKEYERDFSLLRYPEIVVNYTRTAKTLEVAHELFDGILQVRQKGGWWWTMGMTWDFIKLRGLENLMTDMLLYPEWVHRLMDFLCQSIHRKLDFFEARGLLSLNTQGTYVGSGGFGWTNQLPVEGFTPGRVRTIDMWGFAESQETADVSPAMYGEFIFPYQKTILDRFGLNCYGCCEPLHKRWHVVRNFPRLRRISVSPWAEPHQMAEFLGTAYLFSYKPNPVPLAQPVLDEEYVRASLRHILSISRGCRVELIMKDNHTLGGNPRNAVRWVKIAKEEAERV